MPQLNWIGKDKVENHDKDLPFRVLKPNKKLSVGDNDNLLIQGDNLEALKALMPFYYNKVKCIYIDPPYNTGNEKWVYNDKVNSPQIRSWLNKVVGGQDEDLCRHDKWLCMIYPRMKLLHDLLNEKGLIFVSIDDNEVHNLRFVMNDIFGERNFVTDIIWNSRKSVSSDAIVSLNHNHTLLFAKDINYLQNNKHLFRLSANKEKFSNPDNDPKGDWVADPFDAPNLRPNLTYEIINPKTGKKYLPPKGRCWRTTEIEYNKALAEGRIVFGKNGTSGPQLKRYWTEAEEKGATPKSIWDDVGTTTNGTQELEDIFGSKVFNNPKPVSLVKRIVEISTDKDSLVLDSFAGSGTTGHAVLELNKEDGGRRKFILVELETKIAKEITSERIRRVIKGYKKAKYPEGTGQGFQYLDLNGELFNKTGFINDVVDYEDLASYVYFTETKSYLDLNIIDKPYIGSFGSNNYFLLFEGKGKNVLDEKVFKALSKYTGKKIIFADKCLLDEDFCENHNVIFKQIPYELKKY